MYIPTEYSKVEEKKCTSSRAALWARNLKALTCAPKNPNFNKLIASLEETAKWTPKCKEKVRFQNNSFSNSGLSYWFSIIRFSFGNPSEEKEAESSQSTHEAGR